MTERFLEVDSIPIADADGCTFLINTSGASEFTHGIFKYPCKFIPEIPRWFIQKYSNNSSFKYGVLDPFVGSGTTLVESSLFGLPSYGIDLDPLSRLLSSVKTTKLSENEIELFRTVIEDYRRRLTDGSFQDTFLSRYIPSDFNVGYWFPKASIEKLATIKHLNSYFSKQTNNKKLADFLDITMAAIVRKVSYADDQSPKPYISTQIKKDIPDPVKIYLDYLVKYFNSLATFSRHVKVPQARIIGKDARMIPPRTLEYRKAHLAITSPPYINAFDYVRTLKLENFWLGTIDEKRLEILRERQIGTEQISADLYKSKTPQTEITLLAEKLEKIYKKDPKRAYVVSEFFMDMTRNIEAVSDILTNNGYYCIVIGDSRIRGEHIPSAQIISILAERTGLKKVEHFSYLIRNRYLRIPRKGRGGLIKKDHVMVFQK